MGGLSYDSVAPTPDNAVIYLRFILYGALLLPLACGGGGGSHDTGPISRPPIEGGDTPRLSAWEHNMVTVGAEICNEGEILNLSTWEGNAWYYDGVRVFYQIADYTGDASWRRCARYVRDVYRPYVLDNNGAIPGWRVFPHGLQRDWEETGDESSRQAVLLLASRSAYASSGGGESFELSRETAYLIHAYLSAEEVGGGRSDKIETSVSFALGHLSQWRRGSEYVKPFMVGLTFEALIHYYEKSGDERIIPAVKDLADWLWTLWLPGRGAFPYIYCRRGASSEECISPDNTGSPDLNLLVAPAYAWLFHVTGEDRYRDMADEIFVGGVEGAYLHQGKQFNQSYRWSFDYLGWRNSTPSREAP